MGVSGWRGASRHRGVSGCLVFFFSSRRRHTRFDCDWSSDVCSSDLRLMYKTWMQMGGLLKSGNVNLKPILTHKFPLDDYNEAMGVMRSGNCGKVAFRSEEHTSELQSQSNLVCRLLLEKKKTASLRSCPSPYSDFRHAPLSTRSPRLVSPCISPRGPSRGALRAQYVSQRRLLHHVNPPH